MRVVVVVDGPGGGGLADGLGQPLLQPGIDLPDEAVPIDDVEAGDDADVHGPDDHRRRRRDAGGMGHIRSAPLRKSLHAGTNR